MSSQITNHKCPACTGPLKFVGESGKLECEHCGTTYEVAEIEAMYANKEQKAQEAFEQAAEKAASTSEEWDTSALNSDWGEEGEKMKAYNCPSCGAELICDDTTAATSCPYCDNPTVVPGQFGGSLRPDYILPFKLSSEDAQKSLKDFYKGKKFLPDSFSKNNRIKEIKGVYVPFWMFDGKADAKVEFAATRSHSYTAGDYRITDTEHYVIERQGKVTFERIPVDASSKMPDEYMDAVEPFDYSQLKEFSTAYLPGYMADKYDVTAKDCSKRADLRATNTAVETMRQTVTGYHTCTEISKQVSLLRGQVKYALMPVYMLNTKWQGQDYLFAMNGQTGKFIGNLPVDKGKYWRMFGAVAAGVTIVLGTILTFVL